MSTPIACSLTQTAARSQLAEWHGLLASSVVAVDRVSPAELSLRLEPELNQLDALVRLAQREKACCPFFSFALRIETDAVTLQVCVPDDAAGLLDDFARLAS
jgi:hypothetical protein